MFLQLAGAKDLVLDVDLMQPLDRVAGASLLKQHGVDKIFKLDSTQKSIAGCDHLTPTIVRFLCFSDEFTSYVQRWCLMKFIADQINTERGRGKQKIFDHNGSSEGIHFSKPQDIVKQDVQLHVCEAILEQEGVYGDVALAEYHLDLIPIDRDILSLELPEFFRSFYLDYDQTWLHTVATSLVRIQKMMGDFPNVYIVGRGAKMIFDLMNTLIGERLTEPDYAHYEIGNLLLIDRDVDFVTPLCSQLTYEGLLDDTFGIHSGFVEFGPDISGKDQSVKVLLTSHDPIFEETRNRHFSNVSGFLSVKAKDLQAGFNVSNQNIHNASITRSRKWLPGFVRTSVVLELRSSTSELLLNVVIPSDSPTLLLPNSVYIDSFMVTLSGLTRLISVRGCDALCSDSWSFEKTTTQLTVDIKTSVSELAPVLKTLAHQSVIGVDVRVVTTSGTLPATVLSGSVRRQHIGCKPVGPVRLPFLRQVATILYKQRLHKIVDNPGWLQTLLLGQSGLPTDL
ncbi:hypothetical protein ScPMuIL_019013 [Solemya velum]